MVEILEGSDLSLEAAAVCFLHRRKERLQGDLFVAMEISGEPDFTHPADSDRAIESIPVVEELSFLKVTGHRGDPLSMRSSETHLAVEEGSSRRLAAQERRVLSASEAVSC